VQTIQSWQLRIFDIGEQLASDRSGIVGHFSICRLACAILAAILRVDKDVINRYESRLVSIELRLVGKFAEKVVNGKSIVMSVSTRRLESYLT
jgi:hypothetical protein